MKIRKTLFTAILALVMATAVFTGLAYAASDNTASGDDYVYYGFTFDLPQGGITITDTARKKESPYRYAEYVLYSVENTSGYICYINVRSSNGVYIVGKAARVSGTGDYQVDYLSQKGEVGERYVPSGQTSSESTLGAFIGGYWHP